MTHDSQQLAAIYQRRFEGAQDYRNRVWQVLIADFFGQWIPPEATVLDLGCGYGEFINNVCCRAKYGMDLNPIAAKLLGPEVQFIQQDSSTPWPVADDGLDVIFTSNFFEHLSDKRTLSATLDQAQRCLKPGGRLIAMGPNIKFLPGTYWDFWDHYLPLTEASLSEGLQTHGFEVTTCLDRFLPYFMVHAPKYPLIFLKLYLKIRPAWRIWGKQFLVVARKPGRTGKV
jgi:SAM-dependent methyltransferase